MIFFLTGSSFMGKGQIIADHRIVADFEEIPDYYINEVKKMWLVYAGESHSYAIRAGLTELGRQYPRFAVNVRESGTPDSYTISNLRASSATWGDYSNANGWIYNYGEEDWFTNGTAVSRTKAGISYCHNNNLTISAIGLGWCWDLQGLSFVEGLGEADPVYGCRWYGTSKQGPEGDRGWGLDEEDFGITGNTVNINTYLAVTQEYVNYCNDNSIPTRVFFTTGPVDAIYGEAGYGAYLKYERIRDYAKQNTSAILFDYADILCYDNNGSTITTSWNNHIYPRITVENLGGGDVGHIGNEGALRLAKAMWWMLARIAGWDGASSSQIPITGITISGGNTISTRGGTLQLSATVQPSNASNKTVTWSLSGGSSFASINSTTGLLTALAEGTVTVHATSTDGSGVYGVTTVSITNQGIPVTGITISGGNTISTNGGTLQLSATVQPSNASNKTIVWSVINGSGQASINEMGLLRAISNGTVTVKALASDGSGISGTVLVTISNQVVLVKSITIIVPKGSPSIVVDDGTITLTANISPANASNKSVEWSISSETGIATIDQTGILTAVSDGTVTVKATAMDGSNTYGTLLVTISNQINPIGNISIQSENGSSIITNENGTLQLKALITPVYATNQEIMWSINNLSGQAKIDNTGLVTALSNGTVVVKAIAVDGSGAFDEMEISINFKPSDPLKIIVGENDLRITLDEVCTGCRMCLYNLNGYLLDIKRVDSDLLIFDRSNLSTGVYVVILQNDHSIINTGKAIIGR